MGSFDDVELVCSHLHALGSFFGRFSTYDSKHLTGQDIDDGAKSAGAEDRGDKRAGDCPEFLEMLRPTGSLSQFG